MSECLTSEQIGRYVAGQCSGRELEKIKAHLAECAVCRGKVGEAGADVSVDRTLNAGAGRQDDFHTKSMPDASVFQTKGDDVATSLETMTDGYKILGVLPRGGQAVVYKAIQKATKRIVAVKVLLQGEHASKRARYRFEQEIELVARLKHPNIVTIFDSGIAEEQYYYAMEFIKGIPLDEYVDEEKLPLRETMELFGKVASAIAYAHQHGIIHRDLKPGNILVDEQGEPHVLDFGLAKLADGFEQTYEKTVMTTIAGHVLGTLAFMSPEQATADPEAVDVRTDVYSMGVILYKVLTGQFPYPVGGPMFEILQNIRQYDPVRPLKLIPGFNSEVEGIVLCALAKEPQRRYQSAAELQRDIEYWLKGLPIAARSDSSLYVLRKLISKHRYTSTVVALLLLIILGFSYTSFDLYIAARKSLRKSQASIANASLIGKKARAVSRHITLTNFMYLWNAGWLSNGAEVIASHMPADCKERKAAEFLLNPKPLAEKEADFRGQITDEYSWFADFIIAEHYLKDHNRQEALKACRASYKAMRLPSQPNQANFDRWVYSRVEARLYELGDRPVGSYFLITNGNGDEER